jgi:hypothetical protein
MAYITVVTLAGMAGHVAYPGIDLLCRLCIRDEQAMYHAEVGSASAVNGEFTRFPRICIVVISREVIFYTRRMQVLRNGIL